MFQLSGFYCRCLSPSTKLSKAGNPYLHNTLQGVRDNIAQRVQVPKYHGIRSQSHHRKSIWELNPLYLGTWTLLGWQGCFLRGCPGRIDPLT